MVYVISKSGKPLMPTERHGKVKRLLKSGKATVVKRTPFTIQLTYDTGEYVQPVTLGVDPGYKNVGLSAITDKKELFSAEAKIRTDISKLLATRKMYRKNRRYRKTRYRKVRFSNRVHVKPKGWLAPSVRNRIDVHIKLVKLVCFILPVSNIRIETAQFDIQKIENPEIEGEEYQQGDQSGFWNVREYVLWRDNHKCQYCKGKSKDPVLQTHHLESRQTGGNRPANLVTLCRACHNKYHLGEIELPKFKIGFKMIASINVMRKKLYEKIKELGLSVSETYGYTTKGSRISQGLSKTHVNDAYVIAGGKGQLRYSAYVLRQVRKQNRKLYRGIRSHIRNKAVRIVFGFRQWDKVCYRGQEYFIKGRRLSGYFSLSDVLGDTVMLGGRKLDSVMYVKLGLVEYGATLLVTEGATS